jgi:hypothetical protein
MVAGKVAVVLLACWTLVLYQPVLGRLPCNNDQKREILRECDPLNSTPDYTPSRHGACCVAVRKVPGTNMLCIASILSLADKAKYSVRKILGFRDACAPSHPHHQVVNTRSIT